jgi:DNA-binding protein YbaB
VSSMSMGGLSGFSRDPAEIERNIDQWAAGFAAKAQRYKTAQEKTEQIRLTASSPDGGVRVTVRADGSISDIQFTEKIRAMPLPELSAQILSTMRRAQSDIANQVSAVMTEQLGDEDAETRAALLDDLRSRFPEMAEPLAEPESASEKWDYRDEEPAQPPRSHPAPPAPPAPPSPPQARPSAPRRPPRPVDDDEDEDFDPLRD